jgi:peptidase M23-like protein
MPRLVWSEVSGWWSVPLDGEPGHIVWLAGTELGPDNPPPMLPPPGMPAPPNGNGGLPPPDEPPPDFEDAGPDVDALLRGLWFEVAQAGDRGEYEPLGADEFNALDYQQAQACTVPAQHPPQGTLIGFPGQGTHSYTAPPNNWQSDNAVDVWLYPGTVIRACAAGRVSTSLGYGDTGQGGASRFGGKRLHIEHGSGMLSFYMHLERITVRRGAHVRRGQAIGRSGFGACVPHLHFAVSPPFDPRSWVAVTFNPNAPANPPPPPSEPPDEPPPPPRRTPDESWHNLMFAIGPDRRRQRRRVNRARQAMRRALS